MGVYTRSHVYGCWKIREQTWCWNTSAQEVAKQIKWTEYIYERAIATMITVNKQQIMLMSVYFPHTGYADHHVERAYKSIEKLTKSKKTYKL